ncbi:Rtc5p Ecym_4764 [Eremothecium cymbalariae DBVPG|uniref:TLDc domain-containing protein n=1 Tax=Eremothecium cymbalariae (strain CBS 270.75 / DBVPG 7215 / KCTC 17166 / NRRL Y-17582) TaxID=931890 RepID=G8JSQ4_ERECY|nr:hypothetical protein Ecym_4764 [Eremothecium cymbalariae DBVPG\
MGQNASSRSAESVEGRLIFRDEKEILEFFDNQAVRQLHGLELVAFQNNIGLDADLKDYLSCEFLVQLCKLPRHKYGFVKVFYQMIGNASKFPLMGGGAGEDVPTFVGLVKACLLFDYKKLLKYAQCKTYDQVSLIFILLALEPHAKVSKKELGRPPSSYDARKIMESFNDINLETIEVSADDLLQFMTFLLVITKYCIFENVEVNPSIYENWKDYESQALNILRTMNPCIVSYSDAAKNVVTLAQFKDCITAVCPNLLTPLGVFMKHVLYKSEHLVSDSGATINDRSSTVMTDPLLAQLCTLWPKHIIYQNLKKLFIAKQSGFSIRSFQAKVVNWMAPSILLVSGMKIMDDSKLLAKNQRYKSFLQEYPKLKDEDQKADSIVGGKRKVTFAVFVHEAWKVTNKEQFGNLKTLILQLSPRQEVFQASKNGNIYFNTVGGGIGIGNSQPVIKSSGKKYFPGNVSLTIDPSFEFGVFRNVGHGGSISPGKLFLERPDVEQSLECRFIIQDVEVWGCGGDKEFEAQLKQWEWEEAESERRQYINLSSIGEDKALLEMVGLVGHHQSGGSL